LPRFISSNIRTCSREVGYQGFGKFVIPLIATFAVLFDEAQGFELSRDGAAAGELISGSPLYDFGSLPSRKK
jgi:hypothetical protein